jgi:DNA-binding beta-propeller fold protein YncE
MSCYTTVNECSSNVTVINGSTNAVVSSIPSVVPGEVMAYDPIQGYVYIGGNNRTGANTLSFINDTTNQFQGTIPVPWDLTGMAFVPELGMLYVASRANSSVTVIDTQFNRVVDVLPVASTLTGIAWDQALGELFLADAGTGRLEILQPFIPTYNVTFDESGLPAGENWSVSLNGQTEGSTTSAISFIEPNGSYTFSVSGPPGWAPDPSGGERSVAGANLSTSIRFPAPYGSIAGNVTPATGQLWIDGIPILVGPRGDFQVGNLTIGVHSLVAKDADFYAYFNNISVQPGNTTLVEVELTPVASASWNTLSELAWVVIGALAASTITGAALVILLSTRQRKRSGPASNR